jgi:hypothetical protein
MKRKPDPLEELLRRAEAKPPRDLRARTLQRMGLRPAPSTPSLRLWAAGASVAAAVALAWILIPARDAAQPQAPGPSPALGAAPRQEQVALALGKRLADHPAAALPEAAAQDPQLADSVPATKARPLSSSAATVAMAPAMEAPVAVGSGQPLVRRDSLSVVDPAALVHGAGADQSVTAARATASKDRQALPYRLVVKGNRIRTALNERVRLELQVTQYGRVQACVYDSQGRFQLKLAGLDDPSGPLLLEWDGRLADGQAAPSGAYTILIQSPDKTEKVGVLVVR